MCPHNTPLQLPWSWIAIAMYLQAYCPCTWLRHVPGSPSASGEAWSWTISVSMCMYERLFRYNENVIGFVLPLSVWCMYNMSVEMYAQSLTQFCLPRHLGSGFGPCCAVLRLVWKICCILSDVCMERSGRLWYSNEARHRPPAVHLFVLYYVV